MNLLPYRFLILFITIYISGSIAAKDVRKFQGFKIPCVDTSPECLKQSLQAVLPEFIQGFPELKIESLDPFEVDSLDLELSGNITIEFKEAYTRGLKKCIVDYIRQRDEDTFEIQIGCNLISKGKYRSAGRLLMFQINGNGYSTIITRNLKIKGIFQISSTIKEDGLKYIDINNLKTSHSFEGRVSYNMTNLFKGNPEMSNIVLSFMNQNWQMVADEFGSPIIDYCINSILNNIKKLFKAIPLQNIIIS